MKICIHPYGWEVTNQKECQGDMMERIVWKPNMSLATPLYKQIEMYIKRKNR